MKLGSLTQEWNFYLTSNEKKKKGVVWSVRPPRNNGTIFPMKACGWKRWWHPDLSQVVVKCSEMELGNEACTHGAATDNHAHMRRLQQAQRSHSRTQTRMGGKKKRFTLNVIIHQSVWRYPQAAQSQAHSQFTLQHQDCSKKITPKKKTCLAITVVFLFAFCQ